MITKAARSGKLKAMLRRLGLWARSFQGRAVLGIVVLCAIYLVLPSSARRIISGGPEIITTQQVLEESTILFTIPVDDTNIHYGPRYNKRTPYYMEGFAAGDDGTFWLIDVSSRLLHYSSEGKLLGQVTLPKLLVQSGSDSLSLGPSILDVKARGMDLWILAFVEPSRGSMGATLFRLSHSGQELGRYIIPDDSPIRFGTIIFGEHGEILLGNPSSAPQLLQVLDSAGVYGLKLVEGYKRRGKLYSARLDDPGNRYNRSATVQAGDAWASIRMTRPNMILSGVCVCHVNPDGSFYLFTEEWGQESIGLVPPEYRSILHYSEDGTLLARMPEVLTGDDHPGAGLWLTWSWHERLALSADGSIYLLQAMPEERGNTTHFELRHVKFGNARE